MSTNVTGITFLDLIVTYSVAYPSLCISGLDRLPLKTPSLLTQLCAMLLCLLGTTVFVLPSMPSRSSDGPLSEYRPPVGTPRVGRTGSGTCPRTQILPIFSSSLTVHNEASSFLPEGQWYFRTILYCALLALSRGPTSFASLGVMPVDGVCCIESEV